MFEPENDFERALMRASAEPSARPGFLRELMDAEVYIILTSDKGFVPGPDGRATVPESAQLTIATAKRGETVVIPFFSSPARARAWLPAEHLISPEKVGQMFARQPGLSFVLNPGSDYGKEFTPDEIAQLLAGNFGGGPQHMVTDQPLQVMLAHPSDRPEELIAALARELGTVEGVQSAYLMLAQRADKSAQTWMLGVEHAGDWLAVNEAIGRAAAPHTL